MTHSAWLSIQQTIRLFGVSRSTLERRIRNGAIHQSQTRQQGNERQIAFAELVRIFGEPKRRPINGDGGTLSADMATTSPQIDATTARLVEQLEESLKRETARADKESARADQERSRAERYEIELSEQRKANADLVQRLLPEPAKPGFLARLFGR